MNDDKQESADKIVGSTDGLGAWKATLDEKRTITAWDMGDGSFAFKFQNEDNTTEIRLSREAVNAMKALMLCNLNGIDA